LRTELYDTPYDRIDFAAHRHQLAATDVYVPPTAWLRLAYDALCVYERVHVAALRRRALDHCFRLIVAEQKASRHLALSPVNGLLNCLAIWSRSSNHPELSLSLEGMDAW